jgi:putative heme iron utilization protein
MSSTEHEKQMLAKLEAQHRERCEELASACELQRESTRMRIAEIQAAALELAPCLETMEPS